MIVSLLPTMAFAETPKDVTTWSALQDAINAATEPTTIQLTDDLTAPEQGGAPINIPEGKDITIDLNGKVLNANDGAFSVITVDKGGKLTLTDSAPTAEHYFTVGNDGLWTLTDTMTETTKTVTGGVITGGTGMDCGEDMGTNGGGVYVNEGTFTMSGGTITGNKVTPSEDGFSNGFGGGVYVNEGTFTMSGGTITGNTADAGSVCVYDGTFTMSGGNITGNTARYGGGVYVDGGTFTMNGGAISNNIGYLGGGVIVVSDGIFTMTAGTITSNTAASGGGIQNGGTLKLLAATGKEIEITGNTATDAEGGVVNGGEMHLSGKVIIKDNICTNKYNDTVNYPVNLATYSAINIDGALTGSVIYVTHVNDNDEHNAGVLTSGFATNNPNAKVDDFFTYDGPSAYCMDLNADGANKGELEVKVTPISWSDWEKFGSGKGVWNFSLLFSQPKTDYVNVYVRSSKTDSNIKQLKLEGWGKDALSVNGIDLIVDWNATTGKITIPEQSTGAYQSSIGEYAKIRDYYSYYGANTYPCSYNETTGTFNFGVVYYVSQGYFNYGTETLTSVPAYAITNGTQDANGSITVAETAAENETVTVTLKPNKGYALDTLKYNDGNDHDIVADAQDAYKFTMPAKDVTVTATFKEAEEVTITGTLTVYDYISSNGVALYCSQDVEGYYNFRVASNNTASFTGTYKWGAEINGINDVNSYYQITEGGTKHYFIDGEFTVVGTPDAYMLTGSMTGTDGTIYNITLTSPNAASTWSNLQTAINNAPGNATTAATETTTIKIMNDLTVPEQDGASITIPAGKDITIDLNGKVLNADGKFNVIMVKEGGKLTLIDSKPETEHKGYVDADGLWHLGEIPQGAEGCTEKTVTGGVITGGTNNSGVYVDYGGIFIMNGGNIVGNTGTAGGGVYVYRDGNFTVTGGSITGNTASYGGGVFNGGTFDMTDGTISGNTASVGGGVYNDDTFNMTDGTISGNTAVQYGGGVYNYGMFDMTDGTISSNTAVQYGGGIDNCGILYLGGTANITGNTAGSETKTANNLYLPSGKTVTISSGSNAPADGMSVGVTTQTAPTSGNPVQIGTTATDYSTFFSADNSSYNVAFNDGKNVLELTTTPVADVTIVNVEVKDNAIKAGDTTVTVKDANGQSIGSENLEKVAAAINEVLGNEKVKKFDETNLDAATKDNNDKIVDALKNQTTDQTAKDNVNETDISKYLNVTLVSADVDVATTVTVTSMVFDVTPMATITVTGSDGQVTLTTKITNDEINGTVTFLLPVDVKTTAETVAVYHSGKFIGNFEIKKDEFSNKYIEVKTDSFSEFSYIILDETTAGAKIGNTLYASLSDAVSKVQNNQTITLLKNASGTITVSRNVKFTVNANGKTNNATITAGSGYVLSKSGNTYTVETNTGGSGSVIDLPDNVQNGKIEISPKNATAGQTVTVTTTPDKGFTLETLTVVDENGREVEVKSLGDNKYSFIMPNGKVTITAFFMEDNTMLNFFVDVKKSDYFYDAVLWAAKNEITKGTDEVHFSPDMGTTRAQVVTFLWRAAGCPEPDGNASKFTDVVKNSYYEKAVAWAIEQGITKGTSDTTFSPDMVCTRGQIVTFLARFAGVEDADTASAFTDVKSSDYFAAAVKWAKDNGVTEGTSATTFSPNDNCTRAQVVTFLYRWMVK